MTHFGDKSALEHILEKKQEAGGQGSFLEHHGEGAPEPLNRGADSAREMALLLLLLATFFSFLSLPNSQELLFLVAAALGWATWKIGRGCWLAWSRLERFHRIIEQEKYEIEHHRPQEREELLALYALKGFEGALLEEVVNVLMADQDRLLKVMLEEEIGLNLEAYEHPLKQGVGVAIGALAAATICITSFYFFHWIGTLVASLVVLGIGAFVTAYMEKNRIIPAIVWNLALGILSFGIAYFFLNIFMGA